MRAKENLVYREIAGEHLLIPIGEYAQKYNGIISLNDSGLFLWKLLQEEQTRDSLLTSMLHEYDVTAEMAGRDLDAFLAMLLERELLT